MCIICVDIAREKLTSVEALRNLREIYSEIEDFHKDKVIKEILDLEQRERIMKRIEDERNP